MAHSHDPLTYAKSHQLSSVKTKLVNISSSGYNVIEMNQMPTHRPCKKKTDFCPFLSSVHQLK